MDREYRTCGKSNPGGGIATGNAKADAVAEAANANRWGLNRRHHAITLKPVRTRLDHF